MDRSERLPLETCVACGAATAPSRDRGFAFGPSGVLCWSCAVPRGGHYDPEQERWVVEPDHGDLVGQDPDLQRH